jgi:hypothetical protein
MKDGLGYYARYAWTDLKGRLRLTLNSDKRHLGERIVRGVRSGAISRESIFAASLRRDGVGSQVLSRLSVEAAASNLGLGYTHTPFEEIAHAEGDPTAWRDRCEAFFALGQGKPLTRNVSLPHIGLIEFATNPALWKTPHLIAIPHMYVYCDQNPEIYDRVVRRPTRSSLQGRQLHIAAHVRRGDVSASDVSHRFTSNRAVLESLATVTGLLENTGLAFHVSIYSNGKPEEFAEFTDMGHRVELDLGALETFEHLRDADVLLSAKSTFSYVAALYTNGIVLCEEFDRRPLPSWIPRDAKGAFSKTSFLEKLKLRA